MDATDNAMVLLGYLKAKVESADKAFEQVIAMLKALNERVALLENAIVSARAKSTNKGE